MRPKLLAILITDTSGYTAFVGRAPGVELEAAIRQQQRLIPELVTAHGGRIVKWMGDAALCVFDSATEAVRCGHAIQERVMAAGDRNDTAVGRALKAVVHLGDVLVDADGDVYGDAVNLTARLEKAAEPGEVYFSDSVRRAILRADVPHEHVERVELKGIAEPVDVYRTTYARTPVVRGDVAIAAIDFAGVLALADRDGWDVVQPAIDAGMAGFVAAVRRHGGTACAIAGDGALFTLPTVTAALAALREGLRELHGDVAARAALHVGTVHVMPHTVMGRDVHVVEALVPLGAPGVVLLTDEARARAHDEGLTGLAPADALRAGPRLDAWRARYADRALYAWRP